MLGTPPSSEGSGDNEPKKISSGNSSVKEDFLTLTMEQQFEYIAMRGKIKRVSREDLEELVLMMMKSMMMKDNYYKKIIKTMT